MFVGCLFNAFLCSNSVVGIQLKKIDLALLTDGMVCIILVGTVPTLCMNMFECYVRKQSGFADF